MDLNFDDAAVNLTAEDILSKVSEYDIFSRYCKNFVEINQPFCSELRLDRGPDCRIYVNRYNHLMYKDFANGDNLDCFNYVMKKYGCKYYEALNIIANDLGLASVSTTLNPRVLLINDEFKPNQPIVPRPKSTISIIEQPYTIQDYNYWSRYGISLELLEEYNVFSAKFVYLIKGTSRITYQYKNTNPCYAYRFTRDGQYTYKVYWPLGDKRYKWLFSGGAAEDIEGYDQLPLIGDVLILTKSLKDCMCYNVLGYSAISLQGEANKLSQELVDKLLKRFNKIIVNYDSDEQGIKSTQGLNRQYGFASFFIDEHKDLSDYIYAEGLEKAKEMINEKVKNCL